mmetsp:Transcript_88932/g.185848  ORF Transcript_88932/g.185848 Transcript_88932/m.185848 type:complete len:574 (+) Transcript_88932:188-1909(+)
MPRALAQFVVALFPLVAAWDYVDNGESWVQNNLGLCAGDGEFSKQSPIDLSLEDLKPTSARKLFLKYPHFSGSLNMYHNGHSLTMTLPESYRGGVGFVADEKDLQSEDADVYRAWRMALHSPSEHTVGGRRLPLELQITHQRLTGEHSALAVVSVLFEEDPSAPSNFLTALLENGLPQEPWQEVEVAFPETRSASARGKGFDQLLRNASFFAYEGSLTTPPCETGVHWFVRVKPQLASTGQLEQLRSALERVGSSPNGNYRRQTANTTAGNVVVVGSVDFVGGDREEGTTAETDTYSKEALSVSGTSAARARETIATNAELSKVLMTDSEELKAAKSAYANAIVSENSAKATKAEATNALDLLKAKMNDTSGSVMSVHLAAEVEAAEEALALANTALAGATQEVDDAANKLVKAWRKEHTSDKRENGVAELSSTTATPTEFGSLKVATTKKPFVVGSSIEAPAPQMDPLEYPGPEVVLPHGQAANPFIEGSIAETEVSIGHHEGQATLGGFGGHGSSLRLAPNLRQLDGPTSDAYLPHRRKSLLQETSKSMRSVKGHVWSQNLRHGLLTTDAD